MSDMHSNAPDTALVEGLRAHVNRVEPGPAPLAVIVGAGRRLRRRRRAGLLAGTAVAVMGLVTLTVSVVPGRPAGAPAVITGVVPAGGAAGSLVPGIPHVTTSAVPAAGASDPAALVGTWHVEATGEPASSVLVLGEQAALQRSCGSLDVVWRADPAGIFLGGSDSGDSPCFPASGQPVITWLTTATSFRVNGDGTRSLLSPDGTILARLLPGAKLRGATAIRSAIDPPALTDTLRAQFAAPAPLPAEYRAPMAVELLGIWSPPSFGIGRDQPNATFKADGSWSGSDGCNGVSGRWAVASGGDWAATAGGSTLVGCNGSDAASMVPRAQQVGLDGTALVFFDSHGKELTRLVRPGAPAPSPTPSPAESNQVGQPSGAASFPHRAVQGPTLTITPSSGPYGTLVRATGTVTGVRDCPAVSVRLSADAATGVASAGADAVVQLDPSGQDQGTYAVALPVPDTRGTARPGTPVIRAFCERLDHHATNVGSTPLVTFNVTG